MSKEACMGRRRFFTITLGFGILAFIQPHGAWTPLIERTRQVPRSSRLTKLLRQKESARIIGLEYLRIVQHEADPEMLVDLISLGFSDGYKALHNADTAKLRELLRLRMQQDFEEGHIVKLQGWIVSVTEARLCALVALT